MAVLRGTWATVAVLMALVSAGSCAAERDEFQSIKGRVKLPKTARPPTMRVVLNDGASQEEHSTFTRVDGSFEIDNVLPGVYTLQVISIQYNFPTYKLDVKPSGRVRAILFPYLGAERVACSYPLRIEPNAQRGYFEPRPQVGLGYILKNPMVLMMLFSVGMMYIMPKMMENMDPEELKKMQEDQEKMKRQMAGGGLASLFGGGAKDDDDD